MWYAYKIEYYSARKNDILPFATTWMNLEGMMASEIIAQRKKSIIWSHFNVESENQNKQNKMKSLTSTEKRRVVARGDGLWEGEGIVEGN